MERAYTVTVKDSDGNIDSDTTYYPEDLERCGGIGTVVEVLSKTVVEDEGSIEVGKYYYSE